MWSWSAARVGELWWLRCSQLKWDGDRRSPQQQHVTALPIVSYPTDTVETKCLMQTSSTTATKTTKTQNTTTTTTTTTHTHTKLQQQQNKTTTTTKTAWLSQLRLVQSNPTRNEVFSFLKPFQIWASHHGMSDVCCKVSARTLWKTALV